MPQKLSLGSFKGVEYTSQFSKDFIENCNEDSDEECFLEVGVQFLEELHELHNDLPFLPEKMKIEKVEKLVANLLDKKQEIYTHKKFRTSIKSTKYFSENSLVIETKKKKKN